MNRLSAGWLALVLFAANAWLCRELFTIEWLIHMHSIEGAYIGLSQWILTHWPDLAWMPAWYGGIPFQNAYPPLLHLMVAAYAKVAGASPALSHHVVTAFLYCLGPVGMFALALEFTKSRGAAFVSALGYSALSPSAWLIPMIAKDLGSYWFPRRLQALVYYGDGPEVSAMTWIPLAILCVHLALETRKATWSCAAILMIAATVATNWIGAFVLALAMAAYLLARLPRPGALIRLSLIAIASYALVSPWFPPSTVRVVQGNARTVGGDHVETYRLLPRRLAIGCVVLCVLAYFAHRYAVKWQVRFSAFFLILTATITLLSAWGGVKIIPQPDRYHLEMEMAIWLLAAVTFAALPRKVFLAVATAVILLCIYGGKSDRRYARNNLLRSLDIKTRTEYKTAKFIDEHLNGERAFVPGATSFFMQAFTSTPQLTGGFENGITNYSVQAASFNVYVGTPPAPLGLPMLWLKALGVQTIAYGGKDSGEHYKDFHHPEAYDQYETLWRDGGDKIARIPQRSGSLARVITRKDLANIEAYVTALEDPTLPLAEWRWTSTHSAISKAKLEPFHLISIQESWVPGWYAVANGTRRGVSADALGLMLVEPHCAGDCTVDLVYDGGSERQLAIAASFFTMLAMAAFGIRESLRRLR